MKLILTRHGETHENRSRTVQGQTFGELNAFGKAQAKKLGQRLAKEKIDVIYVSDLERARHTADEILKHHPLVPVYYTEELRERSMGSWEGKSWEEVGVDLKNIDTREFPPDAEHDLVLFARGENVLNKLLSKHMGETVLVVAHGAINGMILNAIRGTDPTELMHMEIMGNTAISIFEFDKDLNHVVHVHNCTQHLD